MRREKGERTSRRSQSSGQGDNGEDGSFLTGLSIETEAMEAAPIEEEDYEENPTVISLTYPIEMCAIKRKPTTALTITQQKVEEKLAGLPGRLNLNPHTTTKYFGDQAREHFFDRYKWIDKQMQITQLGQHEATPSFFFDNERLKKHERVNDYAFAPKRPELDHSLDEGEAEGADGSMDEDIRVSQLAELFAKAAIGELREEDEQEEEVEEEEEEEEEESDEEEEIPDGKRLFEETLRVHQEAARAGGVLPNNHPYAAADHAHRVGTAGGGLRLDISDSGGGSSVSLAGSSMVSSMSSIGEGTAPGGEEAERKWLENLGVLDCLDSTLTPLKKHIGHVKGGRFSIPLKPARQASIMMREQKKELESASKRAQKLAKLQATSVRSQHSVNVHSAVALESIKSKLSRLSNATQHSNNPTNSFMLNALAVPNSPRTAYLVGCTKLGVLPRASLVLRKNLTKVLDLKHQGMGDQMAVLLAQSLKSLPYIQSIDLTDNNLGCDGLCAIFESIKSIPNLLSLDIGHNDMGPESSLALGSYLSNSACPLVRLGLGHADVDDFECAKFVVAIQSNKCIKELDLSHNKIGEAENLNSVMPDITTGSEALADMLVDESCALESLDLSWNKIRLDGAVSLAGSLATNKSLTQLDLSYNALGNEAGLVLGESLIENRCLKYLTLKNNGIDTCACFTICQAVIENFCIKDVCLDGNPIGEMGAKALMAIPLAVGSRVKVSANACNISIHDDKCWFDSTFPCRSYSLCLEKPFDRAVMYALLSIVASHQTYIFSKVMYEPALEGKPPKPGCKPPPIKYGKGDPIDLIQTVMTEKEKYFDEYQKKVVEGLRRLKEAASNPNLALKLFRQMDEDGGGELDRYELKSLLGRIGLDAMTMAEVDDTIATYDVDNTGTIGMEEFAQFLKQQVAEADTKLRDMTEEIVMCMRSTPHTRFVPPRSGCMKVDLVDGFTKKALFKAVSDSDRSMIHQTASSTDDMAKSIGFAVENVKLRYLEAYSLYEVMYKETRNRIKVFSTLFPCMADPTEARKLLVKVTDDDKKEQQQIKAALGYIVKPLLGAPDGYYSLDLNKELDKICLYRLMEISQALNAKRQMAPVAGLVLGDCSQHGNWTCFRNEMLNLKPIEITAEAFTPAPKRGILEFDFCSAMKPALEENVLLDRRFLKILNNCCLLKEEKFAEQTTKMAKLKRLCDKALLGNGTTKTHVKTLAQMMEIFNLTEKFYNTMPGRQAAYIKGLKAEEINVDFMNAKITVRGSLNDADFKDLSKATTMTRQPSMRSVVGGVGPTADAADAARERADSGTTTPPVAPPTSLSPAVSPTPTHRRQGMILSKKVPKEPEIPLHMQYQFEPNDPDLYQPRLTGVGTRGSRRKRRVDTAGTRASTADSSNLSRSSTANTKGLLESQGLGATTCPGGQSPSQFKSDSHDTDDFHGDLPTLMGERGSPTMGSPLARTHSRSCKPSPCRQPSIMVCRNPSVAALNLQWSPSKQVLPGIGSVMLTPGATIAKVGPSGLRSGDPEHIADYVPLIVEAEKETPEERDARIREEKADLRRITFKKLLFSPQVPAAGKAVRVVQFLEDILSTVYITCRQVAVMLELFTQGKLSKYDHAPVFGSHRVTLLVAIFSRIVDVQNMHIVLATLEPAEYAAVLCRIGILNLFNPLLPEGHHVVNMGRNRDDRMFAKIFVVLSVVEPGINWINHGFRWTLEESDPWIPGWECTAAWMTDIGMPGRGVLQLTYCSGDGTKKDGFDTCLDLRKALTYMTRVHESDLVTDEERVRLADEHSQDHEGRPCCTSAPPMPGARYVETKIDMFRKYLAVNNVKAALEFAKNGPKAAPAGKGAKNKK